MLVLHVRPMLAASPNGNAFARIFAARVPGPRPSPSSSPATRRRLSTASRVRTPIHRATAPLSRALLRYAAFGAVGLSAAAYLRPPLWLEPASPTSAAAPVPAPTPVPTIPDDDALPLPPPPQSTLAPVELTFGLVCGFCAGVFVKKGAKLVAFTLGGIFVMLQYLSINSFIRVDWQRIGSKFEHLFYRIDPATSKPVPPTLRSLWTWLVNFLTTDFQPRASFLAGLALGLRLG